MKKQVIKCDFCGRELDREKEEYYYEVSFHSMPGWVRYSGSMSDFENEKQICCKCAKKRKVDWKDNENPDLIK